MKEAQKNGKARGSEKKVNKLGRNGDPISLYPLTPEEAMRRMLRVPPEAKETQKREIRKPD